VSTEEGFEFKASIGCDYPFYLFTIISLLIHVACVLLVTLKDILAIVYLVPCYLWD